jgi:tight adherence protein B
VTRNRTPPWTPLLSLLILVAFASSIPSLAWGTRTPSPPVQARISNLNVTDGVLNFTFGTSGVSGLTPEQEGVRVLFDNMSVESAVTSRVTASRERVVVLAIDTSDSMREKLRRLGPTRLKAAQDAARGFLDAVSDDVRVGLVTFAGEPRVLVKPTTDRGQVTSALDALETGPDTALYRGVQEAVHTAGSEGSRSILLLSDGKNEDASGSLDDAKSAIDTSSVNVDVVGLGEQQSDTDLREIATAGKGQVVGADRAEELADRFRTAAEAIDSELDISVVVPERFAGRTVTLDVYAKAGGHDIHDTVAYSFDDSVSADSADSGPRAMSAPPAIGSWAGVVGLLGVCVGLGLLLTLAALSLTRQHTRKARLARLIGAHPAPGENGAEHRRAGIAEPAVALAERLLRRRNWDRVLAVQLSNGGIPLRPAEWLLLHAGAAFFAGLLFGLVTGGNPLAAILGLILGVAAPWLFLRNRARSRHQAFAAALPDTLQMVAGSLSAGLTLQQAVEAVAAEGRAPVSEEIRRALIDVRLGMSLEDALSRVAQRMSSPDFAWVVMAMRIQREVGGNLPELLGVVASTLRERDRLRRQAQVLSAEGRISAWVVGLLPLLFVGYMLVVRPAYLRPLITDPLGWAMLLGGSLLFAGGVLWLVRVSRLKV